MEGTPSRVSGHWSYSRCSVADTQWRTSTVWPGLHPLVHTVIGTRATLSYGSKTFFVSRFPGIMPSMLAPSWVVRVASKEAQRLIR